MLKFYFLFLRCSRFSPHFTVIYTRISYHIFPHDEKSCRVAIVFWIWVFFNRYNLVSVSPRFLTNSCALFGAHVENLTTFFSSTPLERPSLRFIQHEVSTSEIFYEAYLNSKNHQIIKRTQSSDFSIRHRPNHNRNSSLCFSILSLRLGDRINLISK